MPLGVGNVFVRRYNHTKVSIAIGIDLGTTNSVVGTATDDGVKLVVDKHGNPVHPSVVSFGDDGRSMFGQDARSRKATHPSQTVYSTKRLIGQNIQVPMVQLAIATLPYDVVEGANQQAMASVLGREYSMPEVSSMLLQHLKELAEVQFGQEVKEAVITVPANFSDAQRQATKEAGALAGLDVLRLINEPTAAALAYGYGQSRDENIAIFDFGGGTFDVSVLNIQDELFEVLATDGEFFLGGDDVDRMIADHLASEVARLHSIDARQSKNAMNRLRIAAEEVKKYLSVHGSAGGTVDGVVEDTNGNPVSLEFNISRSQFDNLIVGYIDRTIEVCRNVITTSGLDLADISDIILVGGSTRIPIVRQRVAEYFGREPASSIDPDQVVAHGAAIQAAMLSEGGIQMLPEGSSAVSAKGALDLSEFLKNGGSASRPQAILLDVAPATMGVATAGGYVEPIIKKNAPIPIENTKVFTSARDNQTRVAVDCCRGESRRFNDNELLGNLVLEDLPPGARGENKIAVTFRIDADGILNVRASDEKTGQARDAKLNIIGAPVKENDPDASNEAP